jgi:nitrogen fixation protein NifU and related proteins
MSALTSLYQATILEHERNPRHHGKLADATHYAEAHNPLCGDRIRLGLRVAGGVVEAAMVESRGCAISRAAGSMLTEAVIGHRLEHAERLAQRFGEMLEGPEPGPVDPTLGPLEVFVHVRQFPTRIGCALLAWNTLRRAIGPKS